MKNTRFKDRFDHQLKIEFFNVLGTTTPGIISSLLYNTTLRQIRIAMKLKF